VLEGGRSNSVDFSGLATKEVSTFRFWSMLSASNLLWGNKPMSINPFISQVRELVRERLCGLVGNPDAAISQSFLVVKNEFAGVRFTYDDLSAYWKFNEPVVKVFRDQQPISVLEIEKLILAEDSAWATLTRAA
jgi:hypothetical protein